MGVQQVVSQMIKKEIRDDGDAMNFLIDTLRENYWQRMKLKNREHNRMDHVEVIETKLVDKTYMVHFPKFRIVEFRFEFYSIIFFNFV